MSRFENYLDEMCGDGHGKKKRKRKGKVEVDEAKGLRMEKAKELRVMTMDDLIQDTPITKLKVVAKSKDKGIEKFVKTQGLQWKDSPKMMFGGYWYSPKTKEAYMPT
jgi:hypothetical protein